MVVLGTEGFLDRDARFPLSLGSLRALSGRLALSPLASPLVLVAVTGVALGGVVPELGRVRGFRVRLPPPFSRACSGGSISGSTMQILGGVGSGGGILRGSGSGSRRGTPKPSVSSSESAVPGAAGRGSESDRVGRDSLTDVGGQASSCVEEWNSACLFSCSRGDRSLLELCVVPALRGTLGSSLRSPAEGEGRVAQGVSGPSSPQNRAGEPHLTLC